MITFPLRVAAVDVGSNAIRFVAAEFTGPEEYRVLESSRIPIRLGHFAFVRGYLDRRLMEKAIEALTDFRARMDALGVQEHRAVATSAVRESRNGEELTTRIRSKTGIRIEPISGSEEGELVWRALRNRVRLDGQRWIIADLGGGSLEVSLANSGALLWTESLPLGTVRLLEELEPGIEPDPIRLRRLIEDHSPAMAAKLRTAENVEGLIASGGNAEVLADIAGAQADSRGLRRLTLEHLREIEQQLAALTYTERIERLNLREDRADVILPAAIVYERVARLAGTDTILAPGVGLKEGVLLCLVEDLLTHPSFEERKAREVEEGALALGRRFRFDEAHAQHVCRSALQLFDSLEQLHGLGSSDRHLLLAAAILHDVGKIVAHRKHHRHSRYLIRHANLPGLSDGEAELVSLIARYHRGSRPKRSHEAYGQLDSADRKRVKRLTALLRIADGLDQDHDQRVTEVRTEQKDGEVLLSASGEGDLVIDEAFLKRKGRLFERVFEQPVRVAGAGSDA